MFKNIREEDMLSYYLHRYVMSDVSYKEFKDMQLQAMSIATMEDNEEEVLEFASQFIEERGEI